MIATALVLLLLAQTPDELVHQLGADDIAKREEASKALEALGEKAIPALEAGAKSEDPEVHSRCTDLIEGIQQVRDFGARLDPARLERTRRAIGYWRESDAGEAGSAYDNLLDYPDGKTRPADLGDIPYLLALVSGAGPADPQSVVWRRSPSTQARALEALRNFPIVDENEQRLTRILSAILPSPSRTSDFDSALLALSLYEQACQFTQVPIREAIRDGALSALGEIARHERTAVRARAAWIIGVWKEPKGSDILLQLLADSEPEVQREVAIALRQQDPSGLVEPLRRLMGATNDARTRMYAAGGLARAGGKDGLEALFAALDGDDATLHEFALDEIRTVMATPQDISDPQKTAAQAWREWWKGNRDRVMWDPDQQMFIVK